MKEHYSLRLTEEEKRIVRVYQVVAPAGEKFPELVSALVGLIEEAYPGIAGISAENPLSDLAKLSEVLNGDNEARRILRSLLSYRKEKKAKEELIVPDAVSVNSSEAVYEELLGTRKN